MFYYKFCSNFQRKALYMNILLAVLQSPYLSIKGPQFFGLNCNFDDTSYSKSLVGCGLVDTIILNSYVQGTN